MSKPRTKVRYLVCPNGKCGREWMAIFRSGVEPVFCKCEKCGTKTYLSGRTYQPEACVGCLRPFVQKGLKACTYCGRPVDERSAQSWISARGKDREK